MKEFNLSKGTIYIPLKENEEVVNGAVYEVIEGKAQKVTAEGATGDLLGVCVGGDRVREGYVMLDIDPTSAFTEGYTEAPAIGSIVDGCKLVIEINEEAKEYTYLLRTAGGSTPPEPTEDNLFKITVTKDGATGEVTADKEFYDIKVAIQAGKLPYVLLDDQGMDDMKILVPGYVGGDNVIFSSVFTSFPGTQPYYLNFSSDSITVGTVSPNIAGQDNLGNIKVGTGLEIAEDGTLSVSAG